jgi:curved DNA-binding protein CbpA
MARTSDRIQQVNHYQTLRISYNAAPAEVKSAYRGLVKEYHPDCNHHLDNHDQIASINLAYEVLSNPQSRAHYDRTLGIKHKPSGSSQGIKRSPTKREIHLNEDQKIDRWCKQVYEPIIDLIEAILDTDIDDVIYQAFSDLKGFIIKAIPNDTASLQNEVELNITGIETSLTAVYDLTGSIKTEADFIKRNKIVNPSLLEPMIYKAVNK